MSILSHNRLIRSYEDSWEMGTRDIASYSMFTAVVNYFDWFGGHFTTSTDRRTKIIVAGCAIHQHEKNLTNAMLYGAHGQNGLASMSEVEIIGGVDNPQRETLVSHHYLGYDRRKYCLCFKFKRD